MYWQRVAFVHSTLLFAWYRREWQCAPIRFGIAKMLCTGAWSALSDDVPSPVSALKILVQSPESRVLSPESRLKSHSFIGMEKAGRRKSHSCAIAYADLYLTRDIRSRNISSFQPPGVQKQL